MVLSLSWRLLHILQNDLFSPIKYFGEKNNSKDERIEFERSNRIMSYLISSLLSKNQTWQVSVHKMEAENTLSAIIEVPLSSSRMNWSISGTSCWVLTLKGWLFFLETKFWRAIRKFEGSMADDLFFKSDKFWETALAKGETVPDSEGPWHQNEGIVLRIWSIELA